MSSCEGRTSDPAPPPFVGMPLGERVTPLFQNALGSYPLGRPLAFHVAQQEIFQVPARGGRSVRCKVSTRSFGHATVLKARTRTRCCAQTAAGCVPAAQSRHATSVGVH